MKHTRTDPKGDFKILAGTKRSQSATMVIEPRDSEGGPENRHPNSDQWLYVVAGVGKAKVEGKEVELRRGSLLLIEAGERHEIRNTGRRPLKTINLYAPPEYD